MTMGLRGLLEVAQPRRGLWVWFQTADFLGLVGRLLESVEEEMQGWWYMR